MHISFEHKYYTISTKLSLFFGDICDQKGGISEILADRVEGAFGLRPLIESKFTYEVV